MPAWITKTLDFLGHAKGQHPAPTLAPSHELQQSSPYSKTLPPLPPRAYLERPRVRATKRSRTQSPAVGSNGLRERAPIAGQGTTGTVGYEDRSTQTDGSQGSQPRRALQTLGYPDFFSHNAASADAAPVLWTGGSVDAQDLRLLEHRHNGLPLEMRRHSLARPDHTDDSLHPSNSTEAVEEMTSEDQIVRVQREGSQAQENAKDADMLDGPPYTEGDAQIVLSNDGSKDCLALLLTSELVAKINQIATRSQRLEFVNRSLKRVKLEITTEENMLEYKTDALQDTNDQAKIAHINEEIENTQKCLAAAVKCVEALEDEKMTLTANLEFSREQSQEMIENVLGRNDLLEVPDPELGGETDPTGMSVYSVEQRFSQEGRQDTEGRKGSQDAISVEFDDVVRRTAKQDFEEKRDILITLDEAFEHRQENLAEEKAEYLRRVRDGTCDLSPTDFDLLALEDFRRMTTNLKEAQEAFEESFKRAKQLGVLDERDTYYQESVFSEWSGGYAMSMEQAMVGSAPTQRIGYWQESIDPSQERAAWGGTELEPWADPDLEPEIPKIEDCDIRSVEISDSWSCVDWSRRRRRIDRWREIAGRDK